MLTNKNSGAKGRSAISSILALLTLILFAGCQPAGPKALLLGEKFIRQGEHDKALRHLNRASVLIPEQPQVWNHLGLAYHGLDQPVKAADAYQRALRIDRNFAPARYNLGVLYLEQDHLPQAATELNAYVTLTNSAPAFVKLGAVLLRMKRPDDAERMLNQALRLDPKSAEAHNLLGLTHVQRKRIREAMQSFNNALQLDSSYAPAVLNQAVVAHQNFASKEVALERYRTFLTTKPDPKTSGRVQQAIAAIEREIAGVQIAEAAESETNAFSTFLNTNLAARSETNVAATNLVAQTSTNVPVTNPATAITPAPQTNRPAATNLASATDAPARTNLPPAVSTNVQMAAAPTNQSVPELEEPSPEPEPDEPPISVEVVQVEKEPEFKAPTEIAETRMAAAQPGTAPASRTNAVETPLLIPRRDRKEENKPGVLSRMNPARWFRDDESPKETAKATPPTPAPRPSYPPVVKETGRTPSPPRVIPRYQYRKRVPLATGNRAEAEKFFREGAQAHQQRRLSEAIEYYRNATLLDPSYFEAHYNLGLAAYQMKNLPLALAENELAVVAKPSSTDARYNFALTLREANYPRDAANELSTLVAQNPDEVRAHFVLANLYANQLDEPALARRHYLAVLELKPSHPDAAPIRQWLATNP